MNVPLPRHSTLSEMQLRSSDHEIHCLSDNKSLLCMMGVGRWRARNGDWGLLGWGRWAGSALLSRQVRYSPRGARGARRAGYYVPSFTSLEPSVSCVVDYGGPEKLSLPEAEDDSPSL
jgi:hypothetical protein